MTRNELLSVSSLLVGAFDSLNLPWFVCFGTLLSLVRDKELVKANDDLDIGVVGPIDAVAGVMGGVLSRQTYDSTGKQLVNCHIKHSRFKVDIDVFRWVRKNGMLYHCYSEEPSAGKVLGLYRWKGIPESCFFPQSEEAKKIHEDVFRFGRALGIDGLWRHAIPGIETEGLYVRLPFLYGACLDYWYPDWLTRRPMFGVSQAYSVVEARNTSGWL
jgi:hypothetical protein